MSDRKITHFCSVLNCDNKHIAKGLCETHYARLRRHGDPLIGAAKTQRGEAHAYYQNVVVPYDGNQCLAWPYNKNSKGYGQLEVGGKARIVSRLVCEEANGPPPTPKHQAAHSCGNALGGCVTKKHLSWKTPKENHADKLIHGTDKRGERHSMAKLSELQVREILSLKTKEPSRALAKKFNISRQTVNQIHAGKIWRHLQ